MEFRLLGALEVAGVADGVRILAGNESALLALLLLHADESLPTDRIVEELWGERAPAKATKSVQVYVSRLRKALGPERIETTPAGYRIQLAPGELDVQLFDDHARAGRTAAALELWRGPPLQEFRYAAFAQDEARRLEEIHDNLLSDQIDERLDNGEGASLVADLEATIARQPLWERPRAQLMRALYLAGRQGDALAWYRATHELFGDELGVDPSPALQQLEHQILTHDPALGTPRRRRYDAPARSRWRLVAAGGALVLAGGVAALVLELSQSHAESIVAAGDSLAAIDPGSGRIVADFPVGSTPTALGVANGAVWVLNSDDQTISRLDPATRTVKTFATSAAPIGLAAGPAGVWVNDGAHRSGNLYPVATGASRLDPQQAGGLAQAAHLPPGSSVLASIAVGTHIVWATNGDRVFRIDERTGKAAAASAAAVTTLAEDSRDRAWALTVDGHILRIDPRTNRVTFRIQPAAAGFSDLAVGAGSVWAADPYDGTIWRIDPTNPPITRTISVPRGTSRIALGAGFLWAVDGVAGTISQIDPSTNSIRRTISVGNTPGDAAVGDGVVWVTVQGPPRSVPAALRTNGRSDLALPYSSCGDLIHGRARPDYLIASDFPLDGGARSPAPAMSQAVELMLREHQFKAGRYNVALQSCDDSTQQSGNWDVLRCVSNAKELAANRHVLGVIGPFNSGCAQAEIPIANRASLPLVAPTTSMSSLTRAPPPGSPPIGNLYPTGVRTFARVFPATNAEAAAVALLAKQLGARRIYVLRGGNEPYVEDIAPWFLEIAHEVGLTVSGVSTFDPGGANIRSLDRKVIASHPDAVYLAGYIWDGKVAGEIIRDLRVRLGGAFPILTDSAYLPITWLFHSAGAAARGLYVTDPGLPPNHLPPSGLRFLRQFAAIQPGGQLDPWTAFSVAYAAAATQTLLNAIAHSNGTRASVVRALFTTRPIETVTGTTAFDRYGDAGSEPIAVYRAIHPGGSNAILSVQGATLDRIIDVPPRLLRQAHEGN
jgi:branched-chain amino acid transport system substrate-binding protein